MAERDIGPQSVIDAFVDAWNRHDMKAFAALFVPDAEFVNVVGLWWKGAVEIERAHEATHRTMFRDSTLKALRTEIRQPAPAIALVRTLWHLSGHRAPDDSPLPSRTGLLLCVLQRVGPTWRIIDAQNTDIIEGVLSRPQ